MAPKTVRARKEDGDKLQGRTIDIVVGDEQKILSVHELLVRASSPFFDKALGGAWKESLQRTIQLPDEEPKIVALYIHWLYYRTLPVFSDEPGQPGNSEYLDLFKAYVLGDKLLDSLFQNCTIDGIIEKSCSKAQDGLKWYPFGEVIEYAYGNTTDSAPVRHLLVDMYVNHGESSWLDSSAPQRFLFDLSSKLLETRFTSGRALEAHNYYTQEDNHNQVSEGGQ